MLIEDIWDKLFSNKAIHLTVPETHATYVLRELTKYKHNLKNKLPELGLESFRIETERSDPFLGDNTQAPAVILYITLKELASKTLPILDIQVEQEVEVPADDT